MKLQLITTSAILALSLAGGLHAQEKPKPLELECTVGAAATAMVEVKQTLSVEGLFPKNCKVIVTDESRKMILTPIKKTMDVNEHDASYKDNNTNSYKKDLPQIFSCGDSISVGYAPFLKKELSGQYSVVHRKDVKKLFAINDSYSGLARSLISLTQKVLISDRYQPDYLLLNCGLHDVYRGKGGIQQYQKDLKRIIQLAKKHQVTLIWVTTTYKAKGDPKTKTVAKYNKKSMTLMKQAHCDVIDLGGFTLKLIKQHGQAKIMSKDKVHFTQFGYEHQAKFLAEELTRIIK